MFDSRLGLSFPELGLENSFQIRIDALLEKVAILQQDILTSLNAHQEKNESIKKIICQIKAAGQRKFEDLADVSYFIDLYKDLARHHPGGKLGEFFELHHIAIGDISLEKYRIITGKQQATTYVCEIIYKLVAELLEASDSSGYTRTSFVESPHKLGIMQLKSLLAGLMTSTQRSHEKAVIQIDDFFKEVDERINEIEVKIDHDGFAAGKDQNTIHAAVMEAKIAYLQLLARPYLNMKIEADQWNHDNKKEIESWEPGRQIKFFFFRALVREFSEALIYEEKRLFLSRLNYELGDVQGNIQIGRREAKMEWYRSSYRDLAADPIKTMIFGEKLKDLTATEISVSELTKLIDQARKAHDVKTLNEDTICKKTFLLHWKSSLDKLVSKLTGELVLADKLVDAFQNTNGAAIGAAIEEEKLVDIYRAIDATIDKQVEKLEQQRRDAEYSEISNAVVIADYKGKSPLVPINEGAALAIPLASLSATKAKSNVKKVAMMVAIGLGVLVGGGIVLAAVLFAGIVLSPLVLALAIVGSSVGGGALSFGVKKIVDWCIGKRRSEDSMEERKPLPSKSSSSLVLAQVPHSAAASPSVVTKPASSRVNYAKAGSVVRNGQFAHSSSPKTSPSASSRPGFAVN